VTPEGRIKKAVNRLLASYGGEVYRFMPVQSRWGRKTLDYLCCFRGWFLAIETKAPNEELTPLQLDHQEMIEQAGGWVFRVSSDAELAALKEWMDAVPPSV
jgi:hypothetical protein